MGSGTLPLEANLHIPTLHRAVLLFGEPSPGYRCKAGCEPCVRDGPQVPTRLHTRGRGTGVQTEVVVTITRRRHIIPRAALRCQPTWSQVPAPAMPRGALAPMVSSWPLPSRAGPVVGCIEVQSPARGHGAC